jgi:hypothetical protein
MTPSLHIILIFLLLCVPARLHVNCALDTTCDGLLHDLAEYFADRFPDLPINPILNVLFRVLITELGESLIAFYTRDIIFQALTFSFILCTTETSYSSRVFKILLVLNLARPTILKLLIALLCLLLAVNALRLETSLNLVCKVIALLALSASMSVCMTFSRGL